MSTATISADPVPESAVPNAEISAHRPTRTGRWSDTMLVGVLLLVVFVCYGNILANSFVYDDGQQILRNPYVKSWHFVPQIFGSTVWSFIGQAGTTNYYRPLMTFSYLVLWKIFGPIPFGFHLFSLFMQCAVVVMMFYAGRRLFLDDRIAWFAALLFAVHPIHTEAVAWIAALPDLEAAFLLMLAVWLLAAPGRKDWKAELGITLCFCLALLCKEPALMFAPLAVAFEHLAATDRAQTTLRQKVLRYAPLCVAGVAYLLLRVALFGKVAPVLQHPKISWPEAIYSAFALIVKYARLLLWPSRLSAFHPFYPNTSLADPFVIGGVLIIVSCIGAIFLLRKSAPAAAFSILWIGVILAPVLNARWMAANVLTERYLFLPSIGFCWLVAWGAARAWDALAVRSSVRRSVPGSLPDSPSGLNVARMAVAGLLGALILAGVVATIRRNRVWQTDMVLYTRTLETDPDAHIIRSNLGGVYFGLGDLQRARKEMEQALAGKPDNLITMNALGMLYTKQEHYAEANEILHRAMAIKPGWADPHFNLGVLLDEQGNAPQALGEFQKAVQFAPYNSVAHYFYGVALLKAQRYSEAETELKQTVALAPENSFDALSKLASLYLETGQTEQALTVLRRIVAQDPYDSSAHFELGDLLEKRGQKSEALKEYKQGLSMDPANADALAAVRRLQP
jgi:Tfp pilus assembly protein PilF